MLKGLFVINIFGFIQVQEVFTAPFTKLSAVKNELPGKRFQLFDQEHPSGK